MERPALSSAIMNNSDDEDDSNGEQTKTTIFIKIAEGKNFPITDTLSKSSDPYCVLKVNQLTLDTNDLSEPFI